MSETGIYYTPEGIERKLPEYWVNANRRQSSGKLNSLGSSEFAELELDLTSLTDGTVNFNVDRDGDGTNDGFLSNDIYIPAYASIVGVRAFVREAAAGGTSIDVGLFEFDGTAVDADGLMDGVLTASIDVIGDVVNGSGALVGVSSGDSPTTIGITSAGTFTAGVLQIVLEYSLNSQSPTLNT